MRYLYLITFIFLASCSFEENVRFEKIDNVMLSSVKNGMLNLTGEASFYNPNTITGKLKSVDIKVMQSDKVLAVITQNEKLHIEKESSFVVPFMASFALADIQNGLLNNLLDMVTGKNIRLRFIGEIKVSTFGFTQTVPIDYFQEVKL